ncbi:hypothetical protein [Sphingomonas sp. DT-204]|uniref:hypothetical protein n=1 Tax=Sphingomonas sp. DT-204 TaxID=3396166 RepID=UPI003F1B40AB
MELPYWFDLGATIANFISIIFATISAYFWHAASALPLPSEEPLPEDIPGRGLVMLNDEDLSVLQAQIHAMFRRTSVAIDVVNEASGLNAKGARWAMMTAAALAVGLACTLALRLVG